MFAKIDQQIWLFFQLLYIRLWNRYGLLVGTFRAIPITLFFLLGLSGFVFSGVQGKMLLLAIALYVLGCLPIVGVRVWHHLDVQNQWMRTGQFDRLNTEAARYMVDHFQKSFMCGLWGSAIIFHVYSWLFMGDSALLIGFAAAAWVLHVASYWSCAVIVQPREQPETKTYRSADLAFGI